MPRHIPDVVREVCLRWPETCETAAHGMPHFKVRGKTFACYVINHHGDGRVALWLNVPAGAQEWYVAADPRKYFVPPYLGPRGWLGVELNKGLSWKRIAALVREAYEKAAPPALAARLGKTRAVRPPTVKLGAADIDAMRSPRGKALLKALRRTCLTMPAVQEVLQFGYPVWQAGKKTFAWARCSEGHLSALFWVGVDAQGLYIEDARYRVPTYLGHRGWIALDVDERLDVAEIERLAAQSYRHFANRRMLAELAAKLGRSGVPSVLPRRLS